MVLHLSGDPEKIIAFRDMAVQSGLEIRLFSELPLYYEDANIKADFTENKVYIHGSEFKLSKRQSGLLQVLVSKPGHTWSTEELENLLLGGQNCDPTYISVIYRRFRNKIGGNILDPLVQIVKDKYKDNGYRYNLPLEEQKTSQYFF